MTTKDDVLLTLYQHQVEQALEHERQRANLIVLALILTTLTVLGIVAFEAETIGAVLLVLLGLVMLVLQAKHYERHRFHVEVSRQMHKELKRAFGINLFEYLHAGEEVNLKDRKNAIMFRVRMSTLWFAVPTIMVAVGVWFLTI